MLRPSCIGMRAAGKAGCDTEAFYVLGHAAARQVCIPALNSRELLESLALLAPVPEISGATLTR